MSLRHTPDGIAYDRVLKGDPTIIFLHDSLGCIEMWGDFPRKLGERTGCGVVAYDRQGYGMSRPFSYEQREMDYMEAEADILVDLLDHWGVDRAVLFGHSDGGSIALIAGAKFPSRIWGIVTEGAHIFVEGVTVEGIEKAAELYGKGDLKTKLERSHGEKTDEMFWAWADTWTAGWFRDWNIERYLPSVECPSLIIQGEEDEYGTLAQVERTVALTKGPSRELIIPGVRHTPHREAPDLVLRETARFLDLCFG